MNRIENPCSKLHGIFDRKECGFFWDSLAFAVHQAPVETQMTRRDITPVKGLVLVVDDEDMVLETSARMLVTLGFTVQRAGGGREAIEIFRQKAYELDLVVLDKVQEFLCKG